jgi:undecaprenyl-diphosphatase
MTLMAYWQNLNLSIFHAINGFCGSSPFLDRLVAFLDFSGLKGLLFVGTFGVLWFQPGKDQGRRRSTLIVMLLAVAFSILAARLIASVTPFEVRPMHASDIGYRAPLFAERDYLFEPWSGFPSNQATMMFSLATGFWFASRLAGILVGLFSIIAVVARVYLGIHYPGDVFVGALLGIGITALLMSHPIRATLASPFISLEKRLPAFFYGSLFVILFEAGNMFSATRRIGAAVIHIVTGHYD